MTNVTKYNIELRDKNGVLKAYLTPFADNISWEWNRIGGCGSARMTINKAYRSIEFGARDDIQIRVKSGSSSKLVYRGYINEVIPSLKNPQDITLDIKGYFDLLKGIIIHDSGDEKQYEDMELSEIVTDILDSFVTTKTPITKGTIDAGVFSADIIKFFTSADEALRTLAELSGDVEYGVNESLQFFWRTESTSLRKKFLIGSDVETFERRMNWSKLVNKIYLKGGKNNNVNFLKTAESSDSQSMYYLVEDILNNSAISTDTVADQYLGALLKEKTNPILNIRAKIPNTNLRLEDTIPLGEVAFYDADYEQDIYIVGEVADGGSDLTVGLKADGGSDAIIGGVYSAQIDKISYSLSETEERFNIDISLGDSILETSAKLKRIESNVDALQQRS